MTKQQFQLRVRQTPLILDGATGSNLMKAGLPRGVCTEQWLLEHPQVIVDLQRRYAAAGSQVVYAPTFTANRFYLSQHGLGDQVNRINRELVVLSRQAAPEALVAGDMTTLGRADQSYETLLEIYTEQAKALAEAGVDLFIVETMMGLEETMAALEACTMVSDAPVMCSFSVMGDGMLYYGGTVYDAAQQLEGFGASAVGVNCSAGPGQMETIVRQLVRLLEIPVIAKPNAGMPVIDDAGVAHYDLPAEEFGAQMRRLYDAGASVLGGCCGTDPDYILALCRALQ